MAEPGAAGKKIGRRLIATGVGDRTVGLGARGLRRLTGRRGQRLAVLTYHRVDEPAARPDLFPGLISADPVQFERQLAAVARHHRILSLDDLLAIRRGAAAPSGTSVLITFDDGYRDLGEVAWPILRRLGLPATLFVPTAMIDRGTGFWWDRLWCSIDSLPIGTSMTTPLGPATVARASDRLDLFRSWRTRLKALPHRDLVAAVDETCQTLGGPAQRLSLLSWDELRALAAEGLAIAPHSRTHPLLTRIQERDLDEELAGSRAELVDELGSAPAVTAYPSGAHDRQVVAAAAAAGYEVAFTTDRGVEDLERPDWLRLHRINVGGASTLHLIELQLAWPISARRGPSTGVS